MEQPKLLADAAGMTVEYYIPSIRHLLLRLTHTDGSKTEQLMTGISEKLAVDLLRTFGHHRTRIYSPEASTTPLVDYLEAQKLIEKLTGE